MARFLRYTLPAIVWSAVILWAAGGTFSSPHTSGFLQHFIRALFGHELSDMTAAIINVVIRKLAHVTEYALVGWLWFRAIRADAAERWTLRWSVSAVVISILVASSDELRQSFYPSRTASVFDVIVDTCGAVLAQLITKRLGVRRPRRPM
jgi:VanZ family protein